MENGYLEDVTNDIDTDVYLLYSSMFSENEKESVKIEKLAEIFNLEKSEIENYVYEKKTKQQKNESEKFEYLTNLDLLKLESLYKTISAMNKGKNLQVINEIGKALEIKKGKLILENISKLNSEFTKISEIKNWNNFDLNFGIKWENRKENHNLIKANIENYKETNGLYAIFDKDTCLYIGIGRPIWKRIKSHYHSSQRPENKKSIEWSDFFSQYQKELKVYWYQINVTSENKINDKISEILESIMKSIYKPKFNR